MFPVPSPYSTIPLSVPVKEGRQQPYHLLRQRRRAIFQRVVALVLISILVYAVVVFRSVQANLPAVPAAAGDNGAAHINIAESPAKLEPVPDLKLELTAGNTPLAVVLPVEDESTRPHAVVEEKHGEKSVFKAEQGRHTQLVESVSAPAQQVREDDPALDLALQRVLSLLPDEMHIRELLRPVEGTGKEKLREIGLRSRAYKKFFEAWESLHLVTGNGQTYLRHDIVQYLRTHPLSADSTILDFAQTVRSYEAFRCFLQRLSTLLFPWTAPYFPDHLTLHTHFVKGGRGLVFTAGDEQAPYLLISIKAFRRLGCTLPIEIMYLGDSDLGEDYRAELEGLAGVITRDLSQMIEDEGWTLRGWAAKPFAVLMSSFQEVIFVDADALFFENPETLFDDPGYMETGALFFRDRLMMPESKQRWLQQILPKPISKLVKRSRMWTGDSGHMQESGVVLVDKWRHFIALLLVTRMNGPDRDGNDEEGRIGVYDMVYGDKETFWIGWELVGDTDYAFHKGDTGTMGKVKPKADATTDDEKAKQKEKEDLDRITENLDHPEKTHTNNNPALAPTPAIENHTICAPQLLHLSATGTPLWFNGGIFSNRFADKRHRDRSRWEVYMKESRWITEPEGWKLADSNICCLTSDETFNFTVAERETLDMIHSLAAEVGVYGRDAEG